MYQIESFMGKISPKIEWKLIKHLLAKNIYQ